MILFPSGPCLLPADMPIKHRSIFDDNFRHPKSLECHKFVVFAIVYIHMEDKKDLILVSSSLVISIK